MNMTPLTSTLATTSRNGSRRSADSNRTKESRQKAADFTCGEQIRVRRYRTSSFGTENVSEGPFKISKVNRNGTVEVNCGGIKETICVGLLIPCQQQMVETSKKTTEGNAAAWVNDTFIGKTQFDARKDSSQLRKHILWCSYNITLYDA